MQILTMLLLYASPAIAFHPSLVTPLSPSVHAMRRTTTTQLYDMSTIMDSQSYLVDPSYNLAVGALGVGLAGGLLEDMKNNDTGEKLPTAKFFGGLALVFTLFAGFLAFQTTTLRFAFEPDSFSLVRNDGSSLGENVVVGGENTWAYSSFQNWEFLPSSDFPILVYFREDQTPLENREEAPIVVDHLEGQAHFFPAISDSQKLKAGFLEHGCAKIEEK
jgi:hypothetical protein